LKLKIGRYTPNSCPKTWGAIVGSGNCLVVFHDLFSPFQSLFKLPKISIKFRCTPALKQVCLWPRPPCYAREFWKRSFISTVRPTVHTNPSQKQRFSKTLFKLEEFENAGFAFQCGPKLLLAVQRRLIHYNHVIFLPVFSSHTNPK